MKIHKKDFRIFIYYLLPTCIIYFAIFYFLERGVPRKSLDEKFCDFNLKTDEDYLTLVYEKKLPTHNVSKILQYLRFETSYLGQKIIFNQNSGRITNYTRNTVTIQYYLPAVTKYSGKLKCGLDSNKQTKHIKTTVKDFRADANYSRIRCHHEESYTERWCECHNIIYDKKQFIFLSPAKFVFPSPFLIPGARAGPYDVESDRLYQEPVTNFFSIQNYPVNLTIDYNPNYLYGGFYNFQQLWHATFDFVMPFYKFTKQFNVTDTPETRIIYTRSQPIWGFMELFSTISKHHFINLEKSELPPTLFVNLTIGIERNEKYPYLNRTVDDGIGFKYNFDEKSAPTFRDDVLISNNLSTTAVGVHGKPYVLFIDRRGAGRSLSNTYELYEYMKKTCEFCEIDLIKMEYMPFLNQISLVSRASVLAGLHGSGLTNVMWMAASRENHTTHLIEFLPKGYKCRDWYETATKVARVNYHEAMASEKGQFTDPSKLDWCLTRLDLCPTTHCHDVLRDQTMTMKIEDFEKIWLPIVEQLNKTVLSE